MNAHVDAAGASSPAAPSGHLTGPELAARVLGERRAFTDFARARRALDPDDAVQQALVKATERAATLADPSRWRPWFYRVLARTVLDQRAREAKRTATLHELAPTLSEATPDEAAACACALGELDRLRPEYAAIVRRVDLDDEPLPEAAAALGITPNNASVRLYRARRALRDRLFDACGTTSARACAGCDCD